MSSTLPLSVFDDLLIPEPPEDFGNDQKTFEYFGSLRDLVREAVDETNRQTAIAQELAEANFRQSKLVANLRIKLRTTQIELAKEQLKNA